MKDFNWMKYRLVYLIISAFFILLGIYSLITWGLAIGVDFRGGSILEYKLEKSISTEEATGRLEEIEGVEINSIQETESVYSIKLGEVNNDKKDEIKNKLQEISGGQADELRFETVGPSIGPELVKKTIIAMSISAISILLWVAYQFKSIKFGVSAILAMLHDSFILIGMFALLGHLYGAEVDFLFVTALLTILSFSVHDTIVVYDRIREIRKKHGGSVKDIANTALNETMRRSVNNSLTIIFMLAALVFLGGTTVRWFAVALLIGTISGTYSSPFVAVPLLVTWEEISARLKSKKK